MGMVNETQAVEEAPVEEELTPEMEDSIESRKRNMCQQDEWIVDYEFDFKDSLHCRLELSVQTSSVHLIIYKQKYFLVNHSYHIMDITDVNCYLFIFS